jgi:hypothetical protein
MSILLEIFRGPQPVEEFPPFMELNVYCNKILTNATLKTCAVRYDTYIVTNMQTF